MKRRKVARIAAALTCALVVLAAALLLYLNFADLSGWRDTVARLASDAIGRELRINGVFEPEIGFTTRVVATDIALANADWSDDPQMVSVDRLAGEIDLLSLLFGPITIDDIEITGARVLFEVNAVGSFNWDLGNGEGGDGGGGEFELVIGHALLKSAQLLYARPHDRPLEAALTRLEFADDGTGMLDLEVEGNLGGTPLELSGRLGPFIGLINAAAVEHRLSGKLGNIDFTTKGSITDLATLGGADLTARVGGEDLTVVAELLDLPHLPGGSFHTDLAVRPTATGSHLELDASAADIEANLTGTVDSLIKPTTLDVTVEASGTDISKIGSLAGIEDLTEEAFTVSGRVHWAGFPLTCNNIEIQVGENSLSAHGVIGEPPLLMGTDFSFEGGGSDVASIAALAGIRLPRDSFTVAGRLVRLEEGVGVKGVTARIGRSTLEIDGTVGDPPEYAGTVLSISGSGPDLAHFEPLTGVPLPPEPFEIDGRLVEGDGAIALQSLRARLGANIFRVEGLLSTNADFAGTDLRVHGDGPDASQLAAIAGLSDVPAEAYRVDGRLRVLEGGSRVDGFVGSLGTLVVRIDGVIGRPPTLHGSDLRIHAEDSDLSHPASIAGITRFSREPAVIDTRLLIDPSGYRFQDLEAVVGDISLTANGLIGHPPTLEGTEVEFSASGERLSALGPLLGTSGLPEAPFSATGRTSIHDNAIVLDDVVAQIEGNRVTVTGTVQPTAGLEGTELRVQASLPDLERASRLAAGFAELPTLPAEPFTLESQLRIDELGSEIDHLRASLANATVRVSGRIGRPPDFVGTDLVFDGQGTDVSRFASLADVTIPEMPFQLRGRVEHTTGGSRFHEMAVDLGGNHATIDGTLGDPPRWIGTDLSLRASGPQARLIGEMVGIPDLPDQPFELSVELEGTPERFMARDFDLAVGPSDLTGSLTADITDKPRVEVRLDSSHLELRHLRERFEKGPAGDTEERKATPSGSGSPTRVFPDTPLDLEILDTIDAEAMVRVGTLVLPAKELHDFSLDLHLRDGRLEIERLTASGEGEGRVDGGLVFEAVGEVYRLQSQLSVSQLRLDLPGSEIDRMAQPPIDIDLDLEAIGATAHDLASSANGSLRLVIGEGVMDSSILDVVTADILLTLLNAFNPFSKTDPTTELQCGVALLSFEDGVATLEPMAFQSDKMTLLGDGKVDLNTEKLNLRWITKPRKGFGISASMLTNPYIKLGGTLADPSIELKPLEAVTSTGVAVATAGISLVAKGMFDRITAEKKVCKKALEEIEARTRGSSDGPVAKE